MRELFRDICEEMYDAWDDEPGFFIFGVLCVLALAALVVGGYVIALINATTITLIATGVVLLIGGIVGTMVHIGSQSRNR